MGIALLLAAPLVALTPLFIPPPNGCPCPQGLDVSTPFGNAGITVGGAGSALIVYGTVRQRGRIPMERRATSNGHSEVIVVAVLGVTLLILSMLLSQIDLTGPGWSILLYGAQALYLGMLGIGMLLFAGFALITRRRLGSLFLSSGILLCGISLLFTYTLNSDFSTRCFPEVGCSPALAASTVSEMIDLGYLLAVGAFLLALGLSTSLSDRRIAGS